jgi:hypothetical protein
MTLITFPISEKAHSTYHSLEKSKKLLIQQKISEVFDKLVREQIRQEMAELMTKMSEHAQKNGLTEEILDELLADES